MAILTVPWPALGWTPLVRWQPLVAISDRIRGARGEGNLSRSSLGPHRSRARQVARQSSGGLAGRRIRPPPYIREVSQEPLLGRCDGSLTDRYRRSSASEPLRRLIQSRRRLGDFPVQVRVVW